MHFFKLLVPAIACCFLTTVAGAQCKLDKDEKDSFTGKRTRETKHGIGLTVDHWDFIMKRSGDTYTLGVNMVWGHHLDQTFTAGTSILLKLGDGTIITLKADMDAKPEYELITNGVVLTHYHTVETVSRTEFEQLSKSPIVALRTTISDADFDLQKIKDKQTDKIMTDAACMLTD